MTSRMAYPIPEAAQQLGISRTHLYALHRQGRITFTKIGRRTTVTHDELRRHRNCPYCTRKDDL